jgi:hypothetical protein
MTTTYQLDVNELTVGLIDSIKAAFANKKINIIVSEAGAFDETEYRLRTGLI